jgi:hypothetical protein
MSFSMFDKCLKCGTMIVKGQACPNCKTSAEGYGSVADVDSFKAEYESRRQLHVRNYTIYMVLMMGLAMLSLLIGFLIYGEMGSRYAQRAQGAMFMHTGLAGDNLTMLLILCGLGVLWVVMSVLLYLRKSLFPIALNCPKCDVRLDEIGLTDGYCPGCQTQLR